MKCILTFARPYNFTDTSGKVISGLKELNILYARMARKNTIINPHNEKPSFLFILNLPLNIQK